MPCTGGSPWQFINVRKPGGAARLRKTLKQFKLIWKAFERCARKLVAKGGKVAKEWPKGCVYWKWPNIVAFFKELGFEFIDFDGCMLKLFSLRFPCLLYTSDAADE